MVSSEFSDFAILVISSDKYRDLWDPFFACFEKNWVGCPLPIYLGSNTLNYQGQAKVKTILSGPDKDWSTSTKTILAQIKEKYLFIILEDFFIISPVSTDVMLKHFRFMKENQVNHMHFRFSVIPYDKELNSEYGVYEKGAPYRSNVIGFWNRDCMLGLIVDGETPWNFEIMGSYRSAYWDNFLSIKNPPFQTLNTVEKGSYIFASAEYCKKNEIQLSFEKRKVLSGKLKLKSILQSKYFTLINKIPWRYRLGLMNILRKALVSY